MNIGEAIALGGIAKPVQPLESFGRGVAIGQQIQRPIIERQKEDAATAEKFAQMTTIDPTKYSAPRRQLAKQVVDETMGEVWAKYNELEKQKRGSGANYLRQPETQSKIFGLQQQLKNLENTVKAGF